MASIIKNQILKYLSRYFKNLSPDNVNFNAIKGTGEIDALQLDENALTNLLELPAWMKITKASCDKVLFHIPWRNYKSEPMILDLNVVEVEVEACGLRDIASSDTPNILQQSGKYNTITRIVDGMMIRVNKVSIKFTFISFTASLQVTHLKVESKNPSWKSCNLRDTRIKDAKLGMILLFKELSWQAVRIEAQSTMDDSLPPIRLLTNDATLRIIMKKRLSDCYIVESKLVFRLEDLLWVLTDSQVTAALHFVDSLLVLIEEANKTVRKKVAANKLEVLPEYQIQSNYTSKNQLFAAHDVIETSYHILIDKLDLHLSDDPGSGRSCYPDLLDGGAINIKLSGLQVDFYPYHLAIKDRKHWGLYKESRYPHTQWLMQSDKEFRNALLSVVPNSDVIANTRSPTKQTPQSQSSINPTSTLSGHHVRRSLRYQYDRIMTSCLILRIADVNIDRVATFKKNICVDFVKANKERYSLPETEIIHAEFTYYYHPSDIPFPIPPPKCFIQIYPIEIQLDIATILWLNSFLLNLQKILFSTSTAANAEQSADLFYFDVKLDAIMPRVVIELNPLTKSKEDTSRLHFVVSRVTVTNTRNYDACSSRIELEKALNSCIMRSLFLDNDNFPAKESDFLVMTDVFTNHARGNDDLRKIPSNFSWDNEAELAKQFSHHLLWTENKSIWCIHLDSVWGEFFEDYGVDRPIPFVNPFPLTIWTHLNISLEKGTSKLANFPTVTALVHSSYSINAQINKFQVARLVTTLQDYLMMATYITVDTYKILGVDQITSFVAAVSLPRINLNLVVPPEGEMLFCSPTMRHSSSTETEVNVECDWNLYANDENPDDRKSEDADELSKGLSPIKEYSGSSTNAEELFAESSYNSATNAKSNDKMEVPASTFSFKKLMDFGGPKSGSAFGDDFSDTISIRSEDSADSYMLSDTGDQINNGDLIFVANKISANYSMAGMPVDVAEEAAITKMQSKIDSPGKLDLKNALYTVDVVTIELKKLDIVAQSSGLKSIVKICLADVEIGDFQSLSVHDLQTQFTNLNKDWNQRVEKCAKNKEHIKLRVESRVALEQPLSNVQNVADLTRAKADVKLDHLSLQVQQSALNHLINFLEHLSLETKSTHPLLFDALLCNVVVGLSNDGLGNGCKIVLNNLSANNDEETGIITVGQKANSNESSKLSDESEKELQTLRNRITALQYLREENEMLRQYQEEAKVLRSCLNAAQEEILVLLSQKNDLLDKLQYFGSSGPNTK